MSTDQTKTITLIELQAHSEVVRTFAQLCLAARFHLRIFTNPGVWRDLYELQDQPGLTFYIQAKEMSKPVFIRQYWQSINASDLIIFTTLVTSFRFFTSLNFIPPTVLVIHNGHFFFDFHKHIRIAKHWPDLAKDILRLIYIYATGIPYFKVRLLRKISYLTFADNRIYRYLVRQYPDRLAPHTIIPALPFAYFEGQSNKVTDQAEVVTIVIPGTVNGAGKDYETVVSACERIHQAWNLPVRLVLLGAAKRAYGQFIVARLQAIPQPKFQVITFDQVVPQRVFDDYLQQADFLILPIREHLQLGICRERYGYSNISGSVNDMIRFGIPALIPTTYPLPIELQRITASYTSMDELAQLLRQWVNQRHFLEKKVIAKQVLAAYSLEPMRDRMARTLIALLDDVVH